MDAHFWRLTRRRCLAACALALLLIGAALYGVLPRTPLLYLALGVSVGSAIRNAAVMMGTLLYSWREVWWRRSRRLAR